MQLPKPVGLRRAAQTAAALMVALIGTHFTLWVVPHLRGQWPPVRRPAGVEAFLPIDGMLAARHLLLTGIVDAVHPAALAIFLAICLMSLVVAKSFCSHLCPVGLLSELVGRLGQRCIGRTLTTPRWLDAPLRTVKILLLGFFVWAVWIAMDPPAVAAFLASPYARIVDAKMWLLFASPSRLTIAVVGVLAVGSFFSRDLWCRYLCPYGALVGVLGRLAPLKVSRDPSLCTDCRACTRACPARLEVHTLERVVSIECSSCQDCVVACKIDGCLAIRPAVWRRRILRPATVVGLAAGIYLAVVLGFRAAGHWQGTVTEAEYHRRLAEIDSPVYGHPGGRPSGQPAGWPDHRSDPAADGAIALLSTDPLP